MTTADSSQNNWEGKILIQKAVNSQKYDSMMCFYLCFDDLREAGKAMEQAKAAEDTWEIQYISDGLFNDRIGFSPKLGAHDGGSKYDGQVIFSAICTGEMPCVDPRAVPERVQQLAASFGDILNMGDFQQPGNRAWQFRVEFWSISAAKEAVTDVSRKDPHHFEVRDMSIPYS